MKTYYRITEKYLGRVFIWGILLITGSCNIDGIPDLDSTYLPDYNGNLALALVKDTLVVADFLTEVITDSSSISEGSNMEVAFRYITNSEFTLSDDFVDIESFNNAVFIASPIDFFFVTPADTTFTINRSVNFDFPTVGGDVLDSLYYNGGSFRVDLNSGFPNTTVDYSFSTNSFENRTTSVPISVSNSLVGGSAPPSFQTDSVDLNGYLTRLNATADSNIFVVDIAATITIPAGTTLTGSEYINFTLGINNPTFEGVFGFFEQDTFNIQGKRVSLGIFTDFEGTGLDFQSPVITFTVNNSFGIPAGIDFSQSYAEYLDQPNVPFTGDFASSPQVIGAPNVMNFGDSVESTLVVDSNNSNLRDLLASSPNRLVLNLTGYSNIGNTDPNFVALGSKISVEADIFLPLSVKLDGFAYETFVELGDIPNLEGTEEITLLFNTINELPFDGTIDLYFVDENDVRFDSLTNNVLFQAPTVYDADGKATQPAENSTEITLDEDLINSLEAATSLTLITRLNSFGYENDEFVQVFSDYKLITTLSLRGQLNVDLNGN